MTTPSRPAAAPDTERRAIELAALFGGAPTFQVTNAFAFGDGHVVLCIEVTDDDDWNLEGSAIVRVRLGEVPTWEIVHVAHRQALNYFATGPEDHWLLLRGDQLVRVRGAEVSHHPVPEGGLLTGLRPIDADGMAVFGEGGAVYRFADGVWTPIPTATDGRIMEMWFDGDRGYAVATGGVVLAGSVAGLTEAVMPRDAFVDGDGEPAEVVTVHASDGVVRLGSPHGAYRLADGAVVRMEVPDGLAIGTIGEFRGKEYWGAPDFGVLTRDGDRLAPTHATGGIMSIQTTPAAMTWTAGHYVYVFDGESWTELRVRDVPEALVQRVPLDFVPG